MTKEEAIARISLHKTIHKMDEPRASHISEALDMAIEALEKENREGRWEKTGGLFPDDRRIKCSECGYDADGLRDFEKAKFCPECGIKLQQKRKFEIHSADDFVKAVRTIMKESEKI